MKNYIRCVYANKATFIGLLSFIGFIFWVMYGRSSPYNNPINDLYAGLFGAGIGLYLGTGFGLATHSAYKRTRDGLFLDPASIEDYRKAYKDEYCTRKGMELAYTDYLKSVA